MILFTTEDTEGAEVLYFKFRDNYKLCVLCGEIVYFCSGNESKSGKRDIIFAKTPY